LTFCCKKQFFTNFSIDYDDQILYSCYYILYRQATFFCTKWTITWKLKNIQILIAADSGKNRILDWIEFGHKILSLVFSLMSLVLFSLNYDTLLRLYGLQRDVLIPLIAWVWSRLCCLGELRIELTFWCMNFNNCAEAWARTELRWSWFGFRLTWDWWVINRSMSGHDRQYWKDQSSTDCLRAISSDFQNGTMWILVSLPILLF
jgi:hypothetical protein